MNEEVLLRTPQDWSHVYLEANYWSQDGMSWIGCANHIVMEKNESHCVLP